MNALHIAIRRKLYRRDGREVLAIADLAFGVRAGEFLCIVGPSGCGKTTLLSIVAGLDHDYDGTVDCAGPQDDAVPALRPRAPPQARIGFVFQTPRLMPWLTVRENVRLALDPPPQRAGQAESLLAEMQLAAHLDAYPNHLSGGQQRRVALARAFAGDPDLLLLDEPFQSLDGPTAQQLRDLLLGEWSRRRPTVLFVTHDLREALSLGERVLFLSAGPARVVLDLPIELARPRLPDGPAVEALRRRLLELHPDLLRGLDGPRGAEDAA